MAHLQADSWRHAARDRERLAFGQDVDYHYDFTQADVVLSSTRFLCPVPGACRDSRLHLPASRAHNGRSSGAGPNEPAVRRRNSRLYHGREGETTGSPCLAQEIEGFARLIATKLGVAAHGNASSPHEKWATAVAKDLDRHRGRCLILAGERQAAVVHLLAHALNHKLGNVGKTVFFTEPSSIDPHNRRLRSRN